ncbi:MAG: transketolase [Gemmatimonadota bacterium]|nr:transketolase [Gemmatimonadota bacterium]
MNQSVVTHTASLQDLCINAIRTLAMDAVQRAESGHPGTPMALAPLAYVLWTRHLRYNPANPAWANRDRFVLSAGHASMLLYSVLYLTGYDLGLNDIEQFRQWGSRTPGHPEYGHTSGVEATTGPLGQGFGDAVGMAIAEAHLAAVFNRPGHAAIDHHTYFIASDGDLMEGISHEAAALAGHLGLGKLIGVYDDNHITIEGETSLASSTDAARRFEAYGWHVQRVDDGNDVQAIDEAITAAKAVTDRPSLIVMRTHIAYGSPHKQDTAEAHGAPLGESEVALTKENLDWPSLEPFVIPDEALREWRKCHVRGSLLEGEWNQRAAAYARAHPDAARELERRIRRELPDGWEGALPTFTAANGSVATRDASATVLNALAGRIPELMGGAADLAPSTKTLIKGSNDFAAGAYAERNMRFGIREHAMGTVLNGMALHGGIIPYGATFLIFSDYMRPPMRLAAMMRQHVIYVFTHDSIGLGEDGPTHQPIEQLSGLRAVPGLVVMRPADAGETVEAWRVAISRQDGPTALALTRQKVPFIDRDRFAPASGVAKGGYILSEPNGGAPEVILMASGSEVQIVLDAQGRLGALGIRARVVSVPSMELFAQQPVTYRETVLPPAVRHRIAVEAAHPMSWYQWVGDAGEIIGLERFGASAPYQRIYEELGLTPDHVFARARAMLGRLEA